MEITVIVPTYRPKEYIWECLESLREQTLENDKYEVIIVLNGEKEPYYTRILNYLDEKEIKNFKLIYSEVSGVSQARNIALRYSKGKGIAFVDDDDYISLNYLQTMVKSLDIYGDRCVYVANYLRFFDEDKKELDRTTYKKGDVTDSLLKQRKIFSFIGGKVIGKSAINYTEFLVDLKNGEDAYFLAEISKNINKIVVPMEECYYYRRIRKESVHFKKKNMRTILRNGMNRLKLYLHLSTKSDYSSLFILILCLAVIKGIIFQIINSLRVESRKK